MAFFKKYPIFTALLVILLLIFAAQIYFFSKLRTDTEVARVAAERSARTLQTYLQTSPAPTAANLELAEGNVKALSDELRQRIQAVRGQIDSAVGQDVPASASDLLFEVQSFVDRYNALARAPGDEIDPIQLPANFGFSFRNLLDSGVPPEDSQIPGLWKQKEIIQYLMDSLYASGPISITAVDRELLVQDPVQEETRSRRGQTSGRSSSRNTTQGIFSINPLISARVPGAVETLAFRIQFTGYTSALRDFLVQLSSFELPVVVRSVEVAPAPAGATAAAQSGGDDVFGGIFGSQQQRPQAPVEDDRSRRPVVVDNVSSFTIVVEFIQVVLDEADVADAAEKLDAAQAAEGMDL